MKHSKFKDRLHSFLNKLGFRTEYSERVKTEERLRLLLSNQTSFKCKTAKNSHSRIITVSDWAEVYLIYTFITGVKKGLSAINECHSTFAVNGVTLECIRSKGDCSYRLLWDEEFRIDNRINGLKIVTSDKSLKKKCS